MRLIDLRLDGDDRKAQLFYKMIVQRSADNQQDRRDDRDGLCGNQRREQDAEDDRRKIERRRNSAPALGMRLVLAVDQKIVRIARLALQHGDVALFHLCKFDEEGNARAHAENKRAADDQRECPAIRLCI